MKVIIGFIFVVLAVTAQVKKQKVMDWKVQPINELSENLMHRELKKSLNNFNKHRRIIGGNEAKRNQFPYQVGLVMSFHDFESNSFCGGSLISSTRVLTAGHCIIDAKSVLAILGAHIVGQVESTQVRIDVPKSGLVVHPKYVKAIVFHDIAMVKLPSAVKINNEIRPIALPSGNNDFTGVDAVLSGWGYYDMSWIKSPVLRFVGLKVISNSVCLNDLPTFVQDSIICANGEGIVGACKADSGYL